MPDALPGIPPLAPVPPPSPSIATPAPAVTFRKFGDSAATRKLIYDNVLNAATGLKPLSNQRHTLQLANVGYEGPEEFSKKDVKAAILGGTTLSRRLRGTWQLMDNATGQPLEERHATLANVPHLTDDGVFINRGVSYTLAHQLRLSPGIFARQKQNGELEAHVNVLPGKGRGHKLFLDPESGIFKVNLGQANMPLYPLLKAMGAKDADLREAWGNDLAGMNAQKTDPQVIRKLYDRVAKNRVEGADAPTMQQAVSEAFGGMELDDFVTNRTLKHKSGKLDLPTILATTRKLLAINRGEDEADDRDHMAYQHVLGPEDLLAERLSKSGGELRKLLWKISAKGNLKAIQPGFFDRAIQSAIIGSGLGAPIEEINPAEIFDQQSRLTRMGEGGITSMDAVPEESRAVQPTHLGFVDPLRTPESGRVGVDMRLARSAVKGSDGFLYFPLQNTKTGQIEYKSARDLADSTIAFSPLEPNTPVNPNAPAPVARSLWSGKSLKTQPIKHGGNTYVNVLAGGKMRYERSDNVDYAIPHFEDTFSPLANMIPLKSMVKGQRAVMAARMVTQALPLEDGEAPLVQSALPENADRSFEEEYAKHMGAVHAEQPARVLSADKDGIVLQHADGTKKTVDLYDNMPYNRKTLITQTALVKPGDTVQAGQLLARSNYTDAAGVTALGKNLRVAYLPFRGANFEDANVISESAAKRLSSEHAYQHSVDWEDDVRPGKRAFVASFAAKYPRALLDNFSDDGLIKPGTKVGFGDPLVLSVRERSRTHGAIHRGRRPEFVDESQVWEHHAPGVVTDVVNGKKGATVVVKATIPTKVGDKISGRYGDKGVVSMIVPDDEMPTDEKGKPYELLTNPLGVISRVNSAQLIEAALGKVAAATGKPYKLQDFKSKHDLINFALDELRKNNLSDTEAAVDPETGNKIPNVFAGNRWFMKLHHTSEAKVQGRGIGGYTSEGAPAKGGASGAKRIGMLNLGALLSHGAGKVIREAKMIRGQANPEFWSQFMSGYKPTTPEIPKVYEKFLGMLQGSGIHPLRDGEKTHFMAMTNAKIDELAGPREIRNTETVDWKGGLKPKAGGLFDEGLTGGHEGTKWAAIKLHEPLPNPVMEEPIRRVLGITENKMRDVLAGRAEIGGISGPRALQKALQSIDLPKAIEQTRLEIKSNKATVRDAAVRRFGFLKNAERLGIHPGDWMLDRVPVMPPKFRPVTTMGAKKLPLVADANYLYKELFDSNDMLRQMSDKVDDVGDERLSTYDAMKAVSGLGEPTHPKNQERGVKGLLKQIFGSSPKFGMIQRKLLSTTTDLVGRAAIIPNPDLDMDSVGLPEEKAWDLYTPYVVRHLVRRGMPRMQAAQRVKDKDPVAKDALVNEMKQRPVMIDRAPVLHRYGVMAFWPRITKGDTMQISPLVVGGFNADFDGDAMQFHLPADDDAAQEMAEKMLPSRNLFSASKFKAHYLPSQEYVGGLYHATTRIDKRNKPAVFETTADAIRAYNQGQISADRQVHILKPNG
jgi:DNA-directed RNA polymerase beta subunit